MSQFTSRTAGSSWLLLALVVAAVAGVRAFAQPRRTSSRRWICGNKLGIDYR